MKTSLLSRLQHFVRVAQLLVVIGIAGVFAVEAATGPPVLISDSTSTRAIAFESVTQKLGPFNLTASVPFSPDKRTRIAIFAMNLDLLLGESGNALSADAEDAAHNHYFLNVEYAGQVPAFPGIYMIVVRLNDNMPVNPGDVLVRLNLHGISSNRVRIAIGTSGGGPADDVGAVPTPAPATPPTPATPLSIAQYRSQFNNPALAAGPDGVRFLEQVTWGPSTADLQHLRSVGMQAYLDEQFNATPSSYPVLPLLGNSPPVNCVGHCVKDNFYLYQIHNRFFQNALTGPDQLRQRMAFALHEIMPISGRDLIDPYIPAGWVNPYLRKLDEHAFGNFRNLLFDMTLNPAMGNYLDMDGNSRVSPNENFSREIMQLFSVGTDLLNQDGTPVLNPQGERISSYDNATITNLARVFTGWIIPTIVIDCMGLPCALDDYINPMSLSSNTNTYDVDAKSLAPLSNTPFPACSNCTDPTNFRAYKTQELNKAIDILFNHQNTGPFMCTRLIHQFVTSNPSPAYVGRCAAAFANNGAGVRGDLKAVITAIVLDPEARGDLKTDPNYGHLREPVLFMNNQLRAFDATSDYHLAGYTAVIGGTVITFNYITDLGQNLFCPDSVFGYYPADYALPGSALIGPEFGTLTTSSTFKRANFVNTLFLANNGNGIPRVNVYRPLGTQAHYASYQALAGNPQQLVDALDAFLMHNTMSSAMKNNIVQTVTNVANGDPAIRTRTAIYLILSSAEYQVAR